jgi:hypothetical protein
VFAPVSTAGLIISTRVVSWKVKASGNDIEPSSAFLVVRVCARSFRNVAQATASPLTDTAIRQEY